MFIKNVAIVFITLSVSAISGRDIHNLGLPFSRHFKPTEYNASRQNWSINQTQNGFMYFGNNDGLLEYNGQEWKTYTVPNHSAVRYIYIGADDKIYIGAFNEFGYYERNQYGFLIYTSLSSQIKDINVQTVWKIVPYDSAIYFIAERRNIFKYDFKSVTKIPIPPIFTELRAFLVNNVFYIFDSYAGLAVLKDDQVLRYQNEIFSKKIPVYSILPLDKDYIVLGTNTEGLLKVNINKISPLSKEQLTSFNEIQTIPIKKEESLNGVLFYEEFNSTINSELKKNELYYGIKLNDGNIAYTTLKGGIFIMNQNGDFIDRYLGGEGIPDNSALCLFEDMEYNLWVATEKGISVLEPFNGYKIYGTNSKIKGNILSLSSINNNIYIGTTSGLYLIDKEQRIDILSPHECNTVTNDFIYILSFLKSQQANNNHFLFSSLRKIHDYNIQTKEINDIYSVYGSYSLTYYPLDSSIVFIGHSEGITVLKKFGNNKYGVIEKFKGFAEHIRSLFFDNKGNLFVSTEYSGLLMLVFNKPHNFKDYSLTWYNTSNGLPRNDRNYWTVIGDTLVVLTTNGIYYPDKQKNIGNSNLQFKEYCELNSQFNTSKPTIKQVIELKNGDWWIEGDSEIAYFEKETKNVKRQPFSRISNAGISAMCVDNNERLWVASFENLYSFDFKSIKNALNTPRLSFIKITIGQDSILPIYPNYNDIRDIGKIDFKYNSLKVKVAYPSYQNSENLRYSFFLEGIDKTWTSWNNSGKYSISYLPIGDYVLHVKALDSNGYETKKLSLKFSIAPPWYKNKLAFLLYIIIGLVLIYYVLKLNMLRLNREKNKLEHAIKVAISTVEQQKEELIQQAKQLETTNTELDKLSLVARQTDNAVVIMDSKGNYEWINEGFTRMYGYEFDELLHETSRNKIGRNSTLKINDLVNIWYGDKKTIVYESLNKKKNGVEIWVQTTLTPILDKNKEVVKLIAIDTDISKLKEAEKEIQLQTNEAQTQRDIAIKQRDEILQQKTEITDSILYAEKIQKAILPTDEQLKNLFQDCFVLNKPRDIVSGDFFWCHSEGSFKIIGVADCTGHGVPGAFMSLIGISFLKEIILTLGFYKPDEILNLLRYNIINSLKQKNEDSDNKDGMDISLVTIDIQNNIMYYAGANNPIYIINQNSLTEYSPDKMPISIYRTDNLPFTTKTIPIKTGDRVYMFSDGYVDQFGGKNGKKLKSVNFKKTLLAIQNLDFKEQQNALNEFFEEWKSGLEQVDDVLVIGFEINNRDETLF